ncbi:MAG: elongation factor G [Firmicutes bacterium]|nr:elongation factor G [Candidatus Caballimonas caccae]
MMKADNIRNIAVIGHSGEGKTSLSEAILFNGKTIDRLGKVTEKNTVMDYDGEEISRGMSISLAVASTTWKDNKINIIDVPGFYDFEGEFEEAIRAVGSAVLVADANGIVSVGAEKAIEYCLKNKVPLMIFINGIDKENANYVNSVNAFREKYGKKIATLHAPIIRDGKMKGYVSVISGKAFEFTQGGRNEIQVPSEMKDDINKLKEGLMEASAESDEELLNKFLDSGWLSNDDIIVGVKKGLTNGDTIPVLGGSATQNLGVINLMNEIVDILPSPKNRRPVIAKNKNGEEIEVFCDEEKPFSAQVFKTVADPYVGKLNMIRVFTGKLKTGMSVLNATTNEIEKINTLYLLKGKKQEAVNELSAGDIGAVNKLNNTNTGDTLCDEKEFIKFEDIPIPKPVLTMAISGLKSGDEDKVFLGLNKLSEEDLTFVVEKDVDTGETVIRGQGETQLDVICKKLKAKFGVEAVLSDPKVNFKETITTSCEAEGKHKKQTGGAGQFGVANIRFEVGASDGEFEFVDAVVGGAVPKQFIPAVEKGLREAIKKGPLAGYPMVNLKCTLFDGKYHPVDSKEVAFISAAKLAYDEAMLHAKPVLLEPVYTYKIYVPESFTGDVLGDMNKRRGRILGMETEDSRQVIIAEAPLTEMLKYATDLRSMTQGRGKFTGEFTRFETVPVSAQEKIIADAQK